MPQKPLNETQDAADFVTIRVPKGNLGAPVVVEKNYHSVCMFFCRAGITRRAWQIISKIMAY